MRKFGIDFGPPGPNPGGTVGGKVPHTFLWAEIFIGLSDREFYADHFLSPHYVSILKTVGVVAP